LTAVIISASIWSSGYKQGYDLVAGTQQKPAQQVVVATPTQDAVHEVKKPMKESVAALPKEDAAVPEAMNTRSAHDANKKSTQITSAPPNQDEESNTTQDALTLSPQDPIIEKHLATIAQLEETARLQFSEIQRLNKLVDRLKAAVDERNKAMKRQNRPIEILMEAKNWPQSISGLNNRQP
jgi:hypothetical protein